ncbi:titin-like, partial [Asbolus verrucosus]
MVLSLEPGFLDFDNLPDTNFSCVGKVIGGYYADLETNCQMFHVCTIGQLDEPMDIRFLCLNGTVFDQETRVCERIDEVDCSKSEQFYSLNLELYGNTQPSIVEDNPETDPPIIIKSTTTTTTTTTTQRPKPKTTRAPFYTTATPTITAVTKVISTHHFPISSQPDIRFNPEEINISLNPSAPPNIRTKPLSFQQQIYSDDVSSHNNNKKAIVTTHTSYGDEDKDFVRVVPHTQRPQVSSSTPKIKSVNYGLVHDKNQPPATPADINYGFTYHQTEKNKQEYHTEPPLHHYQYHSNNFRHEQYRNFKTTTYRTEHVPTTRKHPYNPHKEPTTYRNPYVVSSLKPTNYHTAYRTEKPQRLQLPLPLLPTLPPLTFSSPAPFSLSRHIESKRYTNDHQPPPRIIISASASVSDASGRRLNYSLGTIGVTPLLEEPPTSYDDYKDHDVVLDPFYHDVPKIKNKRRKRQVKHSDIIRNEQEAVDVLKFLFDWYKDQETSTTVTVPIPPEVITEINEELAPIADAPVENQNQTEEAEPAAAADEDSNYNFRESGLFKRKSKFNIVGDVLSVTEKEEEVLATTSNPVSVVKLGTEDYVDDNYEAVIYQENITNVEEQKLDMVKSTVTNLTPAEITTTETRRKTHSRRTRPPRYRSSLSHRRPNSRHRFSTELFTSRPNRRKPVVEEEIIDALTNQLTTTEKLDKGEEIRSTSQRIPTTTTTDYVEDVPTTDAPLYKSANPTQAESAKVSLHTTPLSKVYKLQVRKEKINKSFIFNCFGKAINKFYSDPRDCRLFHYCTPGYTRNQLLDMKFVCDLGTYFDDEKLICTKVKPER